MSVYLLAVEFRTGFMIKISQSGSIFNGLGLFSTPLVSILTIKNDLWVNFQPRSNSFYNSPHTRYMYIVLYFLRKSMKIHTETEKNDIISVWVFALNFYKLILNALFVAN